MIDSGDCVCFSCMCYYCLEFAGADPRFLDRGFKFRKGGSFSQFCVIFSKIPHENEII